MVNGVPSAIVVSYMVYVYRRLPRLQIMVLFSDFEGCFWVTGPAPSSAPPPVQPPVAPAPAPLPRRRPVHLLEEMQRQCPVTPGRADHLRRWNVERVERGAKQILGPNCYISCFYFFLFLRAMASNLVAMACKNPFNLRSSQLIL